MHSKAGLAQNPLFRVSSSDRWHGADGGVAKVPSWHSVAVLRDHACCGVRPLCFRVINPSHSMRFSNRHLNSKDCDRLRIGSGCDFISRLRLAVIHRHCRLTHRQPVVSPRAGACIHLTSRAHCMRTGQQLCRQSTVPPLCSSVGWNITAFPTEPDSLLWSTLR